MEVTHQTQTRRYRFGPRNQRGLFGGIGWEQVAFVVVTMVVCVVLLRTGGGRLRLLGAFLLATTSVAIATWPIRGHTVQQWTPIISSFLASRVRGRRSSVTSIPPVLARRGLDRSFVDFAVESAGGPAGEVGVIRDGTRRTLSGVVLLRGDAFLLLDGPSRQRITDSWSSALGAIAQHPGSLLRLTWIERTVPDHALRLGAIALSAFSDGSSVGVDVARRSYLALLEQEAPGVLRHECHLVVTVTSKGTPSPSPSVELLQTLNEVMTRCAESGIVVEGTVSPSGLRSLLARGFAPGAVIPGGGAALPLSYAEEWSALRTDGTWHATYWIAEWPRSDVGADFLLPFLLESGFRRTSAVVMQPRGGVQAVREAERARTEKTADLDLRRRHGFAQSARSLREQEAVSRRESELAAGHGAFRFGGYVSVTSATREGLERDCARAEQAAARSHLVLRRLYGAQRLAASFVLPLGRGL